MGEEQKIEIEEVDGVDAPPRARLTPDVERKRDYLAGFLADKIDKETPTDEEFTASANWELRFDAKNVRIAKIVVPKTQLAGGGGSSAGGEDDEEST